MSRVQLSINVSDFDAAVTFCSQLFGTALAKLRPDYANFAIDDPPLKLVLTSPAMGPVARLTTWVSRSAPPRMSPGQGRGWMLRAWTPTPSRAPSAAMRGKTRCGPSTRPGWHGSTAPC